MLTRRNVIQTLAYTGAVASFPRLVRAVPANSKLNLGHVGVGGKGWEDLISSSGEGKLHNVAAICDIDHRHGGEQPKNLGKVQAERALGIGAVTVSVPDHMHATVAVSAMLLGKHVYCQKPLTHTAHEARVMAQLAAKMKLVTQMGNQYHSGNTYRTAVKLIQSGAIGKVKEAHAWTNSPSWPQGMTRPAGEDPIPDGIHWDLWIGVAQPRPYKKHVYHNFNWRGWQEFGGGALGDMGCHVIDPVYWALELTAPTTVTATGSGVNSESYAEWNIVTYNFPATQFTAGELKLTWYEAGKQPPTEVITLPKGQKLPTSGSLFIGEKATLLVPHGNAAPRILPDDPASIALVRDTYKTFQAQDHYRMWTDAILENRQANSPFSYAGPLTEVCMVGTIAERLPGRMLKWNAQNMTFDDPQATALVTKPYRRGWELAALVG
jgi:predicted dehydrogenase